MKTLRFIGGSKHGETLTNDSDPLFGCPGAKLDVKTPRQKTSQSLGSCYVPDCDICYTKETTETYEVRGVTIQRPNLRYSEIALVLSTLTHQEARRQLCSLPVVVIEPNPKPLALLSESSAISEMAYDKDAEVLDVKMGKNAYRYWGVPRLVAAALLTADSPGTYFNTSIRGLFPMETL